ncbi:Peptidoglycan/LPS O-acetylase OafA/YrhL, contains acyltransferase and SGNH-hydrolase domains [Dyella jiangningensis]|uniref:acyltransferase family protein n=1 Tax=Dyella sp. AtDHG13 TaxID=1938897 RepID=UPI0008856A1D|nr:acyltransferase [Dyella sp. AtDHG13]PXV52319.1 peptidoglycan/LPS O-acetylase OafA/YrhL [Dyella sp. AtDHG13]SDK15151.1 Peptidoglycan/LPS O-acetylase OafA/YrhL, contains acyltransferase and SGNH-hydrolase domains [Dyella jiangningensis]
MNRLPGLDLLRATAIVWVMIFHSFVVDGWGHFGGIEKNGWMGVDLFFVLSGFLIGSQVLRPLAEGRGFAFGDFYLRRAFRILPAYLVVVAAYFIWPSIREVNLIQPLWQFLTFTLNLLIEAKYHLAFSHAWSLCVEEHFYLLFPLLAWWLARRPSMRRFAAVCAVVVLGGMLVRGGVWLWGMQPLKAIDQNSYNKMFLEGVYYPTWSRLDGLLMGVMLAAARVYRPILWSRWGRHANGFLLAGVAVVGGSIWLFRDRTGLVPTVLGYPLLSFGMGLLVFAGAQASGVLARWRVPGAGWLATVSYSMYLSHKAVFHMTESVAGAWLDGHGVLTFAGYALAVLGVGAVLYYGVERPFLALRERVLRQAPAKAHAAGVIAGAGTEAA